MTATTAIGGAAVASQLIGAGFSAYASIQSARMQKKMFELNSLIAGKQSDYALEKGKIQEEAVRMATRTTIGKQRAAFAAQNVALDDGTALEMQMDTAKWGEVDALRTRNNAAMEAWGYRLQAGSQAIQGSLAMMSGIYQSGAAAISGISSAGMSAMQVAAASGYGAPRPAAGGGGGGGGQ